MNFYKAVIAIFSILLLMIGIDKFIPFLKPCALLNEMGTFALQVIGGMQILGALLVWHPRFTKGIAGFFLGLMFYFIVRHLVGGTYDIGGAVFMAILCLLLGWPPKFMKSELE